MEKKQWESPGFLYFFRLLSSRHYVISLYVIYAIFMGILFLDSIYAVEFPWAVVVLWLLFISSGLYLIHQSYRYRKSAAITFYLIGCMIWWTGAVSATGGVMSPLFHYAHVLFILCALSASLRLNVIAAVLYGSIWSISLSFYPVESGAVLSLMSEAGTHILTLAFGCLLAVAVRHYEAWITHWRKQAHTDHLTGLANRQGLVQWWERRTPKAGWLGVMDLDNFKIINDTYGHESGDRILAFIAEEFQHFLPPEAFAARMGGDEFMIFLPPGLDAPAAEKKIQRIMEQAGKRAKVPVTAALGLAEITPEQHDFQQLYRQADADMYQKKKNKASFTVDVSFENRKQL